MCVYAEIFSGSSASYVLNLLFIRVLLNNTYIQSQSVSPSEIPETYTLKKVFRALHRLKRLEQVFCTAARALCAA